MISITSKQTTILGAIAVALLLIGGAYLLTGNQLTVPLLEAESTDELLREYAAKDTDADGLPDWQEALYGTNPENPQSFRAGITDKEAVDQGLVVPSYQAGAKSEGAGGVDINTIPGPGATPGTVTDEFARLFFENYLSTRGSSRPSSADMEAFVSSGVESLAANQARADAYGAADIRVSGRGKSALAAYAAAMEAAQSTAPSFPYSEFVYFSDAVSKDDATALANVRAIAEGYAALAARAAAVSVPEEAASAHLALVNAMAHLGKSVGDMASVKEDPIRGMLGLKHYERDADALAAALDSLHAIFVRNGASIETGSPGRSFWLTMEASVAAGKETP